MSEETIKVVVRRREEQGHGVLVLDLASAEGGALPPFEAGAHVDVHLGDGLVRQYSLAGTPADRSVYRLGILKDPKSRGGSVAAHERLREGTEIRIGVPRNHFPLAMDARHTVLVGGGIGITPMIAMAHALSDAGKSFELHYCGRTRAACAFLDELTAGAFADRVHPHFDDGGEAQRLDLGAVLGKADPGAHIYVCGPSGFMDWVIGEARRLGLPEARIHKEYFQVETDSSGGAFDVVARKSGKTVRVEEGQTIVDALAAVGIKIQVSCEQGVCGTCLCNVLEGVPDHRDIFLTDEEKADNDQMLLCCSRAKTETLVLDI
ncbi:PDR/VanB family oxidoreductase [Thauera sinica]|uniref:PDR/VanB family oxidoreductase n=1 Tax=Thauera sinica TaxID=2665146 RepID=A0ABW1AP12_9RHOO|nr:PDR/VanB family oxidoreductase [Thauera sp. K11]ATE62043.1 oxidoreductase [Thauera sp. K11]